MMEFNCVMCLDEGVSIGQGEPDWMSCIDHLIVDWHGHALSVSHV